MKYVYLASLLIQLIVYSSQPLKAANIGGEITYSCTSTPGVIELKLALYRDCAGIPLCAGSCGAACFQTLQVKGAFGSANSGQSYGNISMQLVNVRDVMFPDTAICKGYKSICSGMGCTTAGTFAPAFERYEFTGLYNVGTTSGLPTNVCELSFSWSVCCRNPSGMQNITGNTDLFLETVINRCTLNALGCNNGPSFYSDPSFFLVGGTGASISYAVSDKEGDSLSYEFTPTLLALGTPATYMAPYSAARPMPWTGNATGIFPTGISCNPTTGLVSFTPGNTSNQTFSGVMAVAVKQWVKVNGVYELLSTIKRDAPCSVLNNPGSNNEPTIRTNPPSAVTPWRPQTEWTVIAGTNLCFIATAKDTDYFPPLLSDTTYLRIENGLSELGAQFTPSYSSRPREDEWVFCWTPADSLIRPQPYRFNLIASDNRCPFPGITVVPFSIKVVPPPLSATIEAVGCGRYKLELQKSLYQVQDLVAKVAVAPYKPGEVVQFQSYFFQQELYVNRLQNGAYPVIWEYKINGVSQTHIDTLRHSQPLFTVHIPDTFVCNQSILSLSPEFNNGVSNDCKWYQFGDTNQLLSQSCATLSYQLDSGKWIWIRSIDINGCMAVDSAFVTSFPQVNNVIATNPTCLGAFNGKIELNVTPPSSDYLFKINESTEQASRVFNSLDTGRYTINIKHRLGCETKLDPIILQSMQVLTIDSITSEPPTCSGLQDGRIEIRNTRGGTAPYWYQLESQGFSTTPIFAPLAPNKYQVIVMDASGCKRKVEVVVPNASSLFRNPVITGDTFVNVLELSAYKIDPEPFFKTTWSVSGNPNLALNQSDSMAYVYWNNVGIYQVEVIKSKSDNCHERTSLNVEVRLAGAIEDIALGKISIYPNPVQTDFDLQFQQQPPPNLYWHITDIQGKELRTGKAEQSQTINIEELPAGLYLLHIGNYTTKLVKSAY